MFKKPVIIIIFGVSGDLIRRYVLPAIIELDNKKKLPKKFKVIGITRKTSLNITEILNKDIPKTYETNHEEIFCMDLNDKKEYKNLTERIQEVESIWQEKAEILFYLSLPPLISIKIIEKLGTNNFIQKRNVKILIEKPFGIDLKTAKKQIGTSLKYFQENQIYRVDHYLFKNIISKIISFKKKIELNNENVEEIEINALEEIDVGKRILFYDKIGAIKDMMQSHLLELTAVILQDKNSKNSNQGRFNILKNLEVIKDKTKKGQYEGYINREINPNSKTETFASISLKSKAKNLKNIIITLNTGKALSKKETYIRIKLKNKKNIFIREIINKKHNSYEQVILNAINSNKEYFISQKEVLETWGIINPAISKNTKSKLFIYKKGINIKEILIS